MESSVKVGKHTLWCKESGNPNGIPLIILHGGPGYYSCPEDTTLVDLSLFRVIQYDQRGGGKSTPRANLLPLDEVSSWTPDDFIEELHAVRSAFFGPKGKFVVLGMSWGSCLAMAYVAKYPGFTLGAIVQGVYLGSESEHKELFRHELEILEKLGSASSTSELIAAGDPLGLHKVFLRTAASAGEAEARRLFGLWSIFENVVTYPPERKALRRRFELVLDSSTEACDDEVIGAILQLVLFPKLMERTVPLLEEIQKQKIKCPIAIVQGARDPVCPADVAIRLHQVLRQSKVKTSLKLIEEEVHDVTESVVQASMIDASGWIWEQIF